MKVQYDRDIDAAYIYLGAVSDRIEVEKTVPLDPQEIDGEINLDFDGDGHLVGIEIQQASRYLDREVLTGHGSD